MNVATLFQRQALRTPRAAALRHDGGTTTYGDLHDQAQRFAHLLGARGIGTGDRVAVLLPNDPAFAVVLLGTLWAGATAAVLSPAWAAADAARALGLADARLLVTTAAMHESLGGPEVVTLRAGAGAGGLDCLLSRVSVTGSTAPAPVDASWPATILFSSGTTGDPKGVVLTHGNLAFNARAKIRYCDIGEADRLAMVVPMAHCFGQNVVLLGALLAGAAVRIYPRFDAARVAEGIMTGEVSMLLAAPTAFARLLALGYDAPLRRLRYSLSAAAPLGDDLSARWREASGRPLARGYGLTECSPFATYDAGEPCDAGARVGRAIDGVEVRIASTEDDRWLGEGESGEVAVRGPNVMAGYWRRPAETARALRGGWLRTGDVGRLDAGGSLHLIDRLDDVINVAGFKAWPSDVERVVSRHPDVLESAAYSVPDDDRGAAVGVAVVLRDGAIATPAEIMGFAAERLAGFQRPARVRVVTELPRTASGKVLRRELGAV